MGTSVWRNGIFSKVVKVHEVKCASRARWKYICFSGACVFVCVSCSGRRRGELVRWPRGNKIYVQVSCQRIVSAAVKGNS